MRSREILAMPEPDAVRSSTKLLGIWPELGYLTQQPQAPAAKSRTFIIVIIHLMFFSETFDVVIIVGFFQKPSMLLLLWVFFRNLRCCYYCGCFQKPSMLLLLWVFSESFDVVIIVGVFQKPSMLLLLWVFLQSPTSQTLLYRKYSESPKKVKSRCKWNKVIDFFKTNFFMVFPFFAFDLFLPKTPIFGLKNTKFTS